MCAKPPKAPKMPPPPPPVQAPKTPDNIDPKRRNRNQMQGFTPTPGGTLLTSPSGVGSVSTATNTLLGG